MAEFKEINSIQALTEILDESKQRKVVIFKHSTTCPVSARAWREVEKFIRESSSEVLVTMIKVIESRPVSNQVAEEFGIKHESPQILLISDRKVVWTASHHSVTQDNLIQVLAGETLPFNFNL